MRPVLLLVHGWGWDASFWRPLEDCLGAAERIVWDLGFHGEAMRPALPEGRPVVAVGHSYGLLWLLHHRPRRWHRLVSINGFRRFAGGTDFPAGVAPRLIDRMAARFAVAPAAVYAEFMARCGEAGPDGRRMDRAALAEGLQALRRWDHRDQPADLVLAGRADPIVPPAMSEQAFAGAAVEWHDGGHLLPRQAPEWCAARLRRYCEEVANEGV